MERREKREWQEMVGSGEKSISRFPNPLYFQFLDCFLREVLHILRCALRASRLTLCILSLAILTLNLILSVGELTAQTDPSSNSDEEVSSTQAETTTEISSTTDPSASEASPDGEPPTTPPEETPDPLSETEPPTPDESAQASRKLDPEQMTPEQGDLLAKGDDLSFHNNLIQIQGNGLIKYDEVVLYADHIWADFDENVMRGSGQCTSACRKGRNFRKRTGLQP